MANVLTMAMIQSIQQLHAAGWSQRRISRDLERPRHMHTSKCGTQYGSGGLTQSPVNIGFPLAGRVDCMTYEAIANRPGAYRVVLEERAEGVYVNVLENALSSEPYIDMLQSDLAMAKRACHQDYGIEDHQWQQVADVDWHAPGPE